MGVTDAFTFPNSILTQVGDHSTEPTFATIQVVQVELNTNSTSIFLSRGNGINGRLRLVINAADYTSRIIDNVTFVAPPRPTAHPEHLPLSAAMQITETNRAHKALGVEFNVFHNVDKALRNQVIEGVPVIFMSTL
jgi:hypothetical protein